MDLAIPVESNTSVEVAEKLSKYKDRQGLGTKTEIHQWWLEP